MYSSRPTAVYCCSSEYCVAKAGLQPLYRCQEQVPTLQPTQLLFVPYIQTALQAVTKHLVLDYVLQLGMGHYPHSLDDRPFESMSHNRAIRSTVHMAADDRPGKENSLAGDVYRRSRAWGLSKQCLVYRALHALLLPAPRSRSL